MDRRPSSGVADSPTPGHTATTRLVVSDLRVCLADGRADVVDDVSFSLGSGQMLGLVGESGSGKTTVALALLGYARPGLRVAGGSVLVDGEEMCGRSDRTLRATRGRRVAYVPQDPSSALNPAMKVGTQLREALTSHGIAGADIDQRVPELIEEVKLPGAAILDAYPHQLSGGQQQRVVLAMGFALRPAVIVLDEPTTGLDVTTQRRVLDTIRDLCVAHGAAGIFVSHDLAVIGELVDQVAVMYAGRIVELGAKPDVFAASTHPYTRGLLRAVPLPDRSTRLEGLAGHPPRPGERPPGCAFAPRCEFVQPACTAEEQRLVAHPGLTQLVRCRRASELHQIDRAPLPLSQTGAAVGDAPLLAVNDLCASYASTRVLTDVSLEIGERECVAIVGESGSGKTTLARCVVGLHPRWTGSVSLRGAALAPAARERAPDLLREVQYIFQSPYGSLNPRKSVHQILEQPLERFFGGLGRRDRLQRIDAALEEAALSSSFRRLYPGELSGGERQRVAIARALVVEPDLLVCDEITSALDVSVQAAIVETLRRLQLDRGLTLAFITHNLALVKSIAQRVVVMQSGRVIESGDTATVLGAPAQEYTQTLLKDLPRPWTATAPAP
jgi:peptide/nickel transport system ATP-binding protein